MHSLIYKLADPSIVTVVIFLPHRLRGCWSLLISPTMITCKYGGIKITQSGETPDSAWCCLICVNDGIRVRLEPTSAGHTDMQCGLLTRFDCIRFSSTHLPSRFAA